MFFVFVRFGLVMVVGLIVTSCGSDEQQNRPPVIVGVEAQARIAFASDRDGDGDIYVMDADGSNQINLTHHPAGDRSPSWSPE